MRWRKLNIALLALGFMATVETATAQTVVRGVEHLDSDRPEAWAIQYFTSTTLLGGTTVPGGWRAGSILMGAEVVWIPFLSADQQRVGFNGTKLEDLNKAPVFVRPRFTVVLPGSIAATVGFVPPVKAFGVDPNLIAVAVQRAIYESGAWRAGWRAYGQTGTAKAAFTCPEDVVAFAPGTPSNPSGCLEPSADTATLRYVGFELGVGGSTQRRTVVPHLAVAVHYFDNQFEVNARRFDVLNGINQEFIDRTIQKSHATNVAMTGGIAFQPGDRLEAAFDVFYTPLWVRRHAGAARQNDGLLNAKMLITYRVR